MVDFKDTKGGDIEGQLKNNQKTLKDTIAKAKEILDREEIENDFYPLAKISRRSSMRLIKAHKDKLIRLFFRINELEDSLDDAKATELWIKASNIREDLHTIIEHGMGQTFLVVDLCDMGRELIEAEETEGDA